MKDSVNVEFGKLKVKAGKCLVDIQSYYSTKYDVFVSVDHPIIIFHSVNDAVSMQLSSNYATLLTMIRICGKNIGWILNLPPTWQPLHYKKTTERIGKWIGFGVSSWCYSVLREKIKHHSFGRCLIFYLIWMWEIE